MLKRTALGAALAVALAAAGVAAAAAVTHQSSAASSATAGRVTLHKTKIGNVLATSSGRTLYLFMKDKNGKSACYGQCATYWPPLMKKGALRAGAGVKANLLGTTKRKNGKAQVTTGGRGKAGGVKLADDPADAEAKARDILGLDINGHIVRTLWIEQASDIAREYYLSVTFDRGAKRPLFMFTTQGGVEIEQVAEESPDALVRLHLDPLEGFQPWVARRLVYAGGVEDPSEQKQIAAIVERLYRAFVEFDAMLCEINPLIVTPDGEVKALDSKFTVDDSGLFRHPDVAEWRDPTAADPIETFAREKGVTYVKLDGDVGVLANGAGLGMSTVDVVAQAGGRPANFCDLGGGGSAEGVVDALEVITRDEQVRSIFFNIFGGITRCDEVARGILAALERLDMSRYPIVVRLDGTNAEEGRQILADAGRENIHPEATMLDGARRAVELAAAA